VLRVDGVAREPFPLLALVGMGEHHGSEEQDQGADHSSLSAFKCRKKSTSAAEISAS
jgi:hypothetical protein